MSHTRAKGEGQRSLDSKVRVERDGRPAGRTEAIELTRSVNIGDCFLLAHPVRLYPKMDGIMMCGPILPGLH